MQKILRNLQKKLLELVREFGKVTEHKVFKSLEISFTNDIRKYKVLRDKFSKICARFVQ